MVAITRFAGEHDFLSNFHPSPLALATGDVVPTVEHAYQAYKTHVNSIEFERIVHASTPGEAKRLGRAVTLRPDWEAVKLDVMRWLLALKFMPGSALGARLLATGDRALVEGNSWGDVYWGVCDGIGRNWLGHLLVARRAELRAEENAVSTRENAVSHEEDRWP